MNYKAGMVAPETAVYLGTRIIAVENGKITYRFIEDGQELGEDEVDQEEFGRQMRNRDGDWIMPDSGQAEKTPDSGQTKESTMNTTDLKNELFGATLDGAKAGLAAQMGRKITDLAVRTTGVELPSFLKGGIGKDILPILVCYGIAFLSVAVPGIPEADRIRRYCVLCARGSATVLVNNVEIMDSLRDLATFISGMANQKPLED